LSVKINTELSAKRGTVGEELMSGTVDRPLSKYRKPEEGAAANHDKEMFFILFRFRNKRALPALKSC
jgi:hypothetical protein